jgi:NAD(P) transhydrogenase subunit alpha
MDEFVQHFTVFILACFVGWYVVWKVTPALHTPLMSATNAISGIILVGALLSGGALTAEGEWVGMGASVGIGLLAVGFASINVVGGFWVTQRMLGMFKKKDS